MQECRKCILPLNVYKVKHLTVASLNFCIKHVQGPTSRKQEVLVSVVDP